MSTRAAPRGEGAAQVKLVPSLCQSEEVSVLVGTAPQGCGCLAAAAPRDCPPSTVLTGISVRSTAGTPAPGRAAQRSVERVDRRVHSAAGRRTGRSCRRGLLTSFRLLLAHLNVALPRSGAGAVERNSTREHAEHHCDPRAERWIRSIFRWKRASLAGPDDSKAVLRCATSRSRPGPRGLVPARSLVAAAGYQ